jgi:hypothetical protein
MVVKKNSTLAARIRRVMLADEEVGKIAAAVPGLIGACVVRGRASRRCC